VAGPGRAEIRDATAMVPGDGVVGVPELIAAHAIPVRRCAGVIEALTGAGPSPGSAPW